MFKVFFEDLESWTLDGSAKMMNLWIDTPWVIQALVSPECRRDQSELS